MREKKKALLKKLRHHCGVLGLATAVCLFLQNFATTDTHVPLLFVLAVLFISNIRMGMDMESWLPSSRWWE